MNGFAYFGDAAVKPKSELNMETFLRLLTVQLSHQNPLEPMGDRDFFAQMAQLGQVEGMDDMKASLEVINAAGLMGKTVTAVRPMTSENSNGVNSLVTGEITKITMRDGKRIISLREGNGGLVEIEMGNIKEISN